MNQAALTRVLLFLAVLSILILPSTATGQTPEATPASESSQYKIVGYFPQWAMYARNYRVKDIVTTGSAPKLTHILYAFQNVSTDSRCYQESRLGWGDQSADIEVSYSAEQSVDGVADERGQPIKGHFNQLKKLKGMYPNIKVLASLGGFTWSGRFSDAALPKNREAFVRSCIDLYIKGNLPIWAYVSGGTPSGDEGNTRGAGVFDGIDIDWEYPAAPGFEGDPARSLPPNVYRPEDTKNFTALLAEFRKQLDELGQKTGRHYLLTIAAPAGPEMSSKMELDKIHPYLDFINIMTYDFHGGWDATGPTNFHASLYNSSADPAEPPNNISVDSTISTYLGKGIPPEKIVMGVPFYGRGWTGVPNKNDGLYQSDPEMKPAPATWEDGIEDYKVLKNLKAPTFRDAKTHALWSFDGTTFWNYDDPQVLSEKMEYIKEKKLGGAMFWSLDGDDGTLISAIYEGLNK